MNGGPGSDSCDGDVGCPIPPTCASGGAASPNRSRIERDAAPAEGRGPVLPRPGTWSSGRSAVRIGFDPLSNDRRSTPQFGVVLALGAIVLTSLMPAVRAPATPHMEVAARAPENLHEQVVRHFEQLDEVTQAIESVQAETAWVRERISVLSRQIEARQELLNRRAAEAYMGERAVGFDSVLGAGSFTDLQDAPRGHRAQRLYPGVEIGAPGNVVSSDLQDILKALGGEHTGAGALAFQNSVRRHRGAVQDVIHCRRRHLCQGQYFLDTLKKPLGRIGRR